MQLKVKPIANARYWTAILVASMCGTNLGDFIPDVFRLHTVAGLLLITSAYFLVMLVERMLTRGSELFYWAGILVVRAAATDIADAMAGKAHFGYPEAASMLFVGLMLMVVIGRQVRNRQEGEAMPAVDGVYWFTMLTAGALGTVIGDGVGHAFGSVYVGVPASAVIATVMLALIFYARVRHSWAGIGSYWIAVVAVRWWGTNMGDISAHLFSLVASATLTLAVLLTILLVWRTRYR